MEVMYINESIELIQNKKEFLGIYGDKLDLINNGISFEGVTYNDAWTVKRFLNGLNFKVNQGIINIFNDFEIDISLLKKKLKVLSSSQLKIVLLIYLIMNKKNILVLDYFDKGLSFKLKKRIINYLKTKYNGIIIVISNDLIFLNQLCSRVIVYRNNKILFNGSFNMLYKANLSLDYPEIINFIKLANKEGAKLSFNITTHELLKDIYRSVR